MNLHENIQRIHQMMGIINENKAINLIKDMGLYDAVRYIGGYDKLEKMIGDYEFSKEDKIKFIKEIVTRLCEGYDDMEVGSFNLCGDKIVYDETDNEKQTIEYYNPEEITVERYSTDDEDYDTFSEDDFYIDSFKVPYEELTHSLINKIFYFMIAEII